MTFSWKCAKHQQRMYQGLHFAPLHLCSNSSGRFYYAAINIPSSFTSLREYFKHPAVYPKSKERLFRNTATTIHCEAPCGLVNFAFNFTSRLYEGGKEVVNHYIDQQPKEDQWNFSQDLPPIRADVVHIFDGELLENTETKKTWEFADLDETPLDFYLGSSQRSVDSARAEALQEVGIGGNS